MERTTVAVDLAKTVFQVAISKRPGKTAATHRLRRAEVAPFFSQYASSVVVMEACGTSSYWGRKFEAMGHQVVLLPPSQVHPYVRRSKTDSADAKALLEAFRNEAIRPVPIKSVGQQSLGGLHRFRSGWLAERTARINLIRGVSYLGLTPSEHSSGLKRHLGGISKRGDCYLRMLLVHGSRSVLFASQRRQEPERLRVWALALKQRCGFNKASVALANKLARIIWAVWRQDEAVYEPRAKGARQISY
jgi:transposase